MRGELSLKNQIIQNITKFSQKPLLRDEQVFSHTPDNKNNNTNVIDRKNVFIVGDSLLNGSNENGMKKLNHNVKAVSYTHLTLPTILRV